MQTVQARGVGTEIYYPLPLHLQECFAGRFRVAGSLHESEKAAESVLALPVYPELTADMLAFVAEAVLSAANADADQPES
jgi:dTDP-4-amino-4,6-dideoxygalactose transaminase